MAGFVTPNTPNLPDFLTFLAGVQIPVSALPADSPYPGYAFAQAMGLTIPAPSSFPAQVLYSLAVYNGATHILFSIAPDQPEQSYFANARGKDGYGIVIPSTGLVSASADQGTSSSLAVPEWAKELTVGQLSFMKTDWGRVWLQWTQSYGPAPWVLV